MLTLGSSGEWDSGLVLPESVIIVDGLYYMYCSGAMDYLQGGFMIGLVTSTDGIAWTKYDDPTTAEPPFAESDPVLIPGNPGEWEDELAWLPSVSQTQDGWEMFYTGGDGYCIATGYAQSSDGIHWTKHDANPVFTPDDDPMCDNVLEGPSVLVRGPTYTMYYDSGIPGNGIGVAMGAIGEPLHVGGIKLRHWDHGGGRYMVRSLVQILDPGNERVQGARVTAEWTLPDGSTKVQRKLTNSRGLAPFRVSSMQTGEYELCVTNVEKPGYAYDHENNVETCDTLTVP